MRGLVMSGTGHLLSGLDVATGTFALMIFSAGAALVVLALLATYLLRRAGQTGTAGALWGCALALVGAMCAYVLLDRSTAREQAVERRAIEERAAELTARALAPGSALACLDEVASVVVENACEKPLFASPQAVAAAVAYVDARVSLLAATTALAQRDPAYQPMLERLRSGLEADHFGLVAHVLTTRGCNGADCAELRLLRDPARVVANMKARVFETGLGVHALAWQPNGAGVAAATPTSPSAFAAPPLATTGAGPGSPVLSSLPPTPSTPGSSKFDFPSSNSIPPVSIMNAEPGTPPEAEPRHAAPPPKRPAPSSRRQIAREPVQPPPLPPRHTPPAPAPAATAPPSAPTEPEAAPPAAPDIPVQSNVY